MAKNVEETGIEIDSEVKAAYNEVDLNVNVFTRNIEQIELDGVEKIEPVTTSSERQSLNIKPIRLDFEPFVIDFVPEESNKKRSFGLGWKKVTAVAFNVKNKKKSQKQRSGYIIQILSNYDDIIGVGEVSPLPGLHEETLEDALNQMVSFQEYVEKQGDQKHEKLIPEFDAHSILRLDGELTKYIDSLVSSMPFTDLVPSIRSGLEMALLSIASQAIRTPLPHSIMISHPPNSRLATNNVLLPLNGLVLRGSDNPLSSSRRRQSTTEYEYSSFKVKVGHNENAVVDDAQKVSQILWNLDYNSGIGSTGTSSARVRADANRAWTLPSAIEFASVLKNSVDVNSDEQQLLEYIEEPLQKYTRNGKWEFSTQLAYLEEFYEQTGTPYALDESLYDLSSLYNFNFTTVSAILLDDLFMNGSNKGCAALVLKPAILGLEFSMRLARLARNELGIGAVFTSSFDTGLGLGYASFLAVASNSIIARKTKSDDVSSPSDYAHGLSTFSLLNDDVLSPPFSSYVRKDGKLKVSSLGRALYGLGLDEMKETSWMSTDDVDDSISQGIDYRSTSKSITNQEYQSVSTSSSGREMDIKVSLPLPFTADIAYSLFTDLPQQSRWSPWLSSVEYIPSDDVAEEKTTAWNLNIRGVSFTWRARSQLLSNPHKGIIWESTSGLKNRGKAEFISNATSDTDTCLMTVQMKIIAPSIIATIFPGGIVVLEDFLKNKLLKWSLEMFRDVVKADIALERGDVELGDALIGAVEGKANAIEATLGYESNIISTNVDNLDNSKNS